MQNRVVYLTSGPRAPRRARRTLVAAILTALTLTFIASPAVAANVATRQVSTKSAVADRDASIAPTANLANFRPGNIISDQVFFDSSTMSAPQVQRFFESKVQTCRSGYTCLKDFKQNTPNRAADSYCDGYSGAANESASTIIYKAAISCGINPQVLIVMLEKEQSLVTHTWPSQWRYDMALGQGCPDTAPCDPAFAGFFYQIYGAARQMQIYAEGKWFTWYAPGKTWNILYNPNTACGSSPVYIENKATAALYYYTPYQPNAAALRAGYGTGDSCSAYGNRNFFNFFEDWFGSTQSPSKITANLAQSPSGAIYLISNGTKHYIADWDLYVLYRNRLGNPVAASDSSLNALGTGVNASRYVHDARTGTLYLLEPDGTKHRFPTADAVTRFGYVFAGYVNLTASQSDAFRTAEVVNDYFIEYGKGDIYKYENGTKRHVANPLAWQSISGGTVNYVASMNSSVFTNMPTGAPILAPSTLVTSAATSEVSVTGTGAEIAYLPSFGLAHDAGIFTMSSVSPSTFSQLTKDTSSFASVMTCSSGTFVVGGGKLNKTDIPQPGAAPLVDSICAPLAAKATQTTGKILIQVSGSPNIYLLENARVRHVRTIERLREITAGSATVMLTWSQDTLKGTPVGAPVLGDGSFVSLSGPEVYWVSGGRLRHVTTPQLLVSLNGGAWPRIENLPAEFLTSYSLGDPVR